MAGHPTLLVIFLYINAKNELMHKISTLDNYRLYSMLKPHECDQKITTQTFRNINVRGRDFVFGVLFRFLCCIFINKCVCGVSIKIQRMKMTRKIKENLRNRRRLAMVAVVVIFCTEAASRVVLCEEFVQNTEHKLCRPTQCTNVYQSGCTEMVYILTSQCTEVM